jgi:serine/threonine protein kinase
MEEAKAVWDLRHFGIPLMRTIVRLDDGSLALIMSYLPGPTLEELTEDRKGIDPEHVCWIMERTLSTLRYLHFHGIVHGDVKPQNIIIQPETHQVVLVDYGLSLIRPTQNSSSKGYTPFFSSPEQTKDLPVLPESDFYALGMTMIHSLGGNVERKHVPEKVPEPVCEFIKRLIVKSPLERPSWGKEDLIETMQRVRVQAFGRASSAMKVL